MGIDGNRDPTLKSDNHIDSIGQLATPFIFPELAGLWQA
jgi:hypothetical protein